MITRYVLHLTAKKGTVKKSMTLTYLSAGGNNCSNNAIHDNNPHKLTSVSLNIKCPDDAHALDVTAKCFDEWEKKAEKQLPQIKWYTGTETSNEDV